VYEGVLEVQLFLGRLIRVEWGRSHGPEGHAGRLPNKGRARPAASCGHGLLRLLVHVVPQLAKDNQVKRVHQVSDDGQEIGLGRCIDEVYDGVVVAFVLLPKLAQEELEVLPGRHALDITWPAKLTRLTRLVACGVMLAASTGWFPNTVDTMGVFSQTEGSLQLFAEANHSEVLLGANKHACLLFEVLCAVRGISDLPRMVSFKSFGI
jgi:hypothetical protein